MPQHPAMPLVPPREPREEPWYDTRYRPSNEDPADRVGARYRGGPDPRYAPADYPAMPPPWPRPTMFDGRDPGLPGPFRAPPPRVVAVRDPDTPVIPTPPTGGAPIVPPPTAVEANVVVPPPRAPDVDALLLPRDAQAVLPDTGWPQMLEPPATSPMEPLPPDPLLAAPPSDLDQLVQEQYPGLAPEVDPLAAAEQAFDAQMRLAFSPPAEPGYEPFPGYGGLEQRLCEPPGMMPELSPFPDPGAFMM
jgi:hypothetical protein